MIDEKKLIEELKKRIRTPRSTMEIERDIIPLVERQPKAGEWIPADQPLEDGNYILLSFANFSCPMIGRYEENEDGGAYYLGDCGEEDTCIANDLFVNTWMPLPEAYKE